MKILHVVHCIDAEGPLTEDLYSTFQRINEVYKIKIKPSIKNLKKIQNKEINLGKYTEAISQMVSPKMLKYNNSWDDLKLMLKKIMSKKTRFATVDDFGFGWKFSWHCVDHLIADNPRKKTVGYGKIFNFYKKIIKNNNFDEINWHFHPKSLNNNPLAAATSYNNSMVTLIYCLTRRIIENKWFPVVNRPGFHSIRSDSNSFLEQWIPYDYSNQRHSIKTNQIDLSFPRFGEWSRATKSWRGYHPDFQDYQKKGNLKRVIFRCLNLGTRFRNISEKNIIEAFKEAKIKNKAILAFASHDFRDFTNDLIWIKNKIEKIRKMFPTVKLKFSKASEAASDLHSQNKKEIKIKLTIKKNKVLIKLTSGEIFGPQPFFAIKTKKKDFLHDNLDIVKPKKIWSYVLDKQTLERKYIEKIGIGCASLNGNYFVKVKDLK
jgi:hypothetical protein